MSRYDTYSRGDDRIREDLDAGFVGFNNRLRPDQLQSAFLQKSQNGRLDKNGQWQVRRGLKNILTPFAVSGTAVRLPVEAEIDDNSTLYLPYGINAAAKDGSNNDRVDITTASYSDVTADSFSRSSTTLTINETGHGLSNGDVIFITGLSVTAGANPNGSRVVTNQSTNSFDVVIANLSVDPTGTLVYSKRGAVNHNIAVGDTIKVTSLKPANSVAINGTFPNDTAGTGVTAVSGSTLEYDHGVNSDPGTITITEGANFTTDGTDVTADSYSRSGTTLTITEADHGLTNGTAITISGLSVASGTNPNGDRFITNVATNTFDVIVAGMDATPTGTLVYNFGKQQIALSPADSTTAEPNEFLPKLGKAILNDTAVSEVTCSTRFSNPNNTLEEEFVLIASNSAVKVLNTSDINNPFDMVLKSGETIPVRSEILQVFNKIVVFRSGQPPLVNDKFFEPLSIQSAVLDTNVVTITTFTAHGLEADDFVDISGLSGTATATGHFTVASAPSATTFTYALTASNETFTVAASALVSPAFNTAPTGAFSNIVRYTTNASGVDVVDGVCTATLSSTSGLRVGDKITVVDAGSSTFTVGDEFIISTLTSTTITFKTDVADKSSKNFVFTKPLPTGGGFIHSPLPRFGILHQGRLAVPFEFDPSDASDRKIRDEIIISDIADMDTYDPIANQFRLNAGASDFIVGMLSFADNQLVVFNRNSLHLINLQGTTNLAQSTVRMITDEVGCIARQSIIQVGSNILFLSDNGVYGMTFIDRYNLRGTEIPLSESINETIKRINLDQADQSVAAYFENRYYIAVPFNKFKDVTGTVSGEFMTREDALLAGVSASNVTDSVAQTNNVILIYNFLNKQWESVDTLPTDFDILDLVVSGKGTSRAVYAVNTEGGVHRLEDPTQNSGFDSVITELGETSGTSVAIDARARTRLFNLGVIDRKKWRGFEIHTESDDVPTDFDITANTENIDQENINLGSLRSLNDNVQLPADEDIAIRGRIGNERAYGLDIEISNTTGRPKLRAVKVTGILTFRSDIKAD